MRKATLFILIMFSTTYAKKLNIGLCIMATGKYISFVKPLLDSAEKYFCPRHKKTYFIFTDSILPEKKGPLLYGPIEELVATPYNYKIKIIYQKKIGWPYDTLMRFSVYAQHADLLSQMDYLFATDADMLFVDYEGDEILGDRVATCHPGYEGKKPLWPDPSCDYDRNPESTAYIAQHEGTYYFAGGFYGGTAHEFLKMAYTITKNITIDLEKNYIARWHDESHLNRYFIDNPPTVILDRSYCYPEHGAQVGYPLCNPKLIALDKDHGAIRRRKYIHN